MRKMTTFLKLSALGALFLGVASLYSCKPEPPEEKLDAPTGLDVKNLTSVGATLTWATVEGATLYNVEINGAPETSTTTSYTINTLAPETDVTWRVQAVKGETKSAWTDGQAFRTPKPTIPDPTDLRQADVTPTSANFTWVAPAAGGVDKYRFRIEGGSLVATPAELTVTNTSVDNLEPGVAYNWAVQSMIGTYEGAWINHSTGFTTPAVSNPTNARASEVLMESATLTWTAGQYATEYVIKSTQFNGGNEIIVTGNTHRVDGLAPKTNYTWQIQGKLGDYRAPAWVDGAAFTTVAAQTPLPTGLEATEVTYNSAKLSWQHADADKHEVRLNSGTAIPVTGLTYTATGLESETSYTWQVRSSKDEVWSDWATAAQPFETEVAPPEPPANRRMQAVYETSAIMMWDQVTGVSGYEAQVVKTSEEYTSSTRIFEVESQYNGLNLSGLVSGTEYKWRVRSVWSTGVKSSWGDGPVYTTLTATPSKSDPFTYNDLLGNFTAAGNPIGNQQIFVDPTIGPATWTGATVAGEETTYFGFTNAFVNQFDITGWIDVIGGNKLMFDDSTPWLVEGDVRAYGVVAYADLESVPQGTSIWIPEGRTEIIWDAETRTLTFDDVDGINTMVGIAVFDFANGGTLLNIAGGEWYENLVMTLGASGNVVSFSGNSVSADRIQKLGVNNPAFAKKMPMAKSFRANRSTIKAKRTNYVER